MVVVGFSHTVSAQTLPSDSTLTATAEITATGRVLPSLRAQQLSLEVIHELHFDQSFVEQTIIIVDPIRTPAGPESGAGYMVARGQAGARFSLLFSENVSLVHSEEDATLQMLYRISHGPTDVQSSSEFLTNALITFTLNDQGEYHFWIGGELRLIDFVSGTYLPDFIVEVLYQ